MPVDILIQMNISRTLAWICLLLTPLACAAQVSDADFCRNGGFPREDRLSLGIIQGRKHESVGWVPANKVAPLPAPPLDPVRDWLGTWSDGVGTIRIWPAPGAGRMQIESKLRWDGGTAPNGEPRANFGGMHGVLEMQGSRASAAEGACQVMLTRIGRYLVADDDGDCGGINVRHTGVYSRLSAGR